MTFEVTFDEADVPVVENYMRDTGMTISEVARQAILEMIFQDDSDLAAYEKSVAEFKKNPTTYTLSEVEAHFNQ